MASVGGVFGVFGSAQFGFAASSISLLGKVENNMATKKAAKKAPKKAAAKKKAPARKAAAKKAAPVKKPAPAIKAKMTKSQIVASLAESTGLTKKQVNAVMDDYEVLIERSIKKRAIGEFTIPGMMRFTGPMVRTPNPTQTCIKR